MSADLALTATALTRRFGSFVAVDGVDLQVPRGAIFGFLGANGAGKTTTIRMLCGLLAPTSGSATVDGVDVVRDPDGVKARIGYMAQKFSLYDDLSVDENIRFFADVYLVPRKQMRSRRDAVLESVGLQDRAKTITKTLPVGIKQRLALACALVHQPRVLFLDEPTAGVDPLSRRSFWAQIHHLSAAGVTIFVTTHHLDEAENCHTVVFMRDGKSVGLGPPRALRQAADRGDMFRVEGVDRAQLVASPLVKEFTPMGSRWHVRLKEPASIDDFRAALRCEAARIAPSLEDVFIEACQRTEP